MGPRVVTARSVRGAGRQLLTAVAAPFSGRAASRSSEWTPVASAGAVIDSQVCSFWRAKPLLALALDLALTLSGPASAPCRHPFARWPCAATRAMYVCRARRRRRSHTSSSFQKCAASGPQRTTCATARQPPSARPPGRGGAPHGRCTPVARPLSCRFSQDSAHTRARGPRASHRERRRASPQAADEMIVSVIVDETEQQRLLPTQNRLYPEP
eukprot:7384701-Prymnesium_polylepis.2